MKLAFVGNWNNLPFAVAFGLCRFNSQYDIRIINTRIKLRNTPHFKQINFISTKSKLLAVESGLDISGRSIIKGDYRLNTTTLESIAWCDILFVCGENFYLSNIVKDKPVIGIPIGFEIEQFGSPDIENHNISFFRTGLVSCDAYIQRNDFSRYTKDFLEINNLCRKNLDYPSFPIPFELTKLIINTKKHPETSVAISSKYIFYSTRITNVNATDQFGALDAKGHEIFFEAALKLLDKLKELNIIIYAIGRDNYSISYLSKIKEKFGESLIILPELEYSLFLHFTNHAICVVETVGDNKIIHGTTSDSLALGTPTFSAFNLSNSQKDLANYLSLDNIIYDASNLDADQLSHMLLENLLNEKKNVFKEDKSRLKYSLDSWGRMISDERFSLYLDRILHVMLN